MVENGLPQLFATVRWLEMNGHVVTDTVSFESDTPEPTSLLLLLTGLSGLGFYKRAKKRPYSGAAGLASNAEFLQQYDAR